MKKINVAELLKDCPKGMELDCSMIDNVVFEKLDFISSHHPIIIRRTDSNKTIHLTKYGQYSDEEDYKCVIFPKGKTTWEEFVPPYSFKDGDIITDSWGDSLNTCIFKGEGKIKGTVDYYCGISSGYFNVKDNECRPDGHYGDIVNYRLATEEEKAKLFQAIKDNGYKWNEETKTLEKLIEPKFHEGDWVVTDYGKVNQVITASEDGEGFTLDDDTYFSGSWKDMYHLWTIKDAKDGDVLASDNDNIILVKESRDSSWGYRLSYHCAVLYNGTFESREFHVSPENFLPATKEQRELLFQKMKKAGYKWNAETKTLEKLIEPKFKVGDRIKSKDLNLGIVTITKVCEDHYELDDGCTLKLKGQDYYELVPNKFDINTLVTFESRVLVRAADNQFWRPAIWGVKQKDWDFCCVVGGEMWEQCIPYECNEHLIGKTNDCADFYKTWK